MPGNPNLLFESLMACPLFAPDSPVRLKVERHDPGFIETTIVGINKAVTLLLVSHEQTPEGLVAYADFSLVVTWEGNHWDTLISVDAAPIKVGDEWQCSHCPVEGRNGYTSLQAFWDGELFAPMRAWIEAKKLLSRVLLLKHLPEGGATWADLLNAIDASANADPNLFAALPIRAAK